MTPPRQKRLRHEQRSEILRRLKAGEGVSRLAREFGTSQPAISQIKARGVRPAKATTSAGAAIAVRVSPVEIEALSRFKARYGFESNSDAMRSLLRMAVGLLEFEQPDGDEIEAVATELHKIGVNVNQIALAANRGRTDLVQQQWSAIDDLRRSLPEIRSHLKAVVDEQRRRGTRLYEKYAGVGDV
ncbi:plasmid mobilization relaxosome protein MobC [Paracoccus sp. CPCC 101403]|uniref:Plasmid mobilization relaxosome protein MobC n=1 Tax=Paracoccus broussonetiae TaxID=3075834 RepID=A0ABU3EJ84_9RHOB|nr:plasmid mobilization relaxosome protein MobC [Paracoccus sp. CPCC 101403]MDT1064180.1 plasmid mobilization relaxosome protein MobC [Paracoccus sp. CPCC 101403]